MTVDELIEAAAELDERSAGLFDRLARISAQATREGLMVTVNLDGKLTGLELTEAALRLGAETLASEIFRLTQEAAATALAEGFATLSPLGDDELLGL